MVATMLLATALVATAQLMVARDARQPGGAALDVRDDAGAGKDGTAARSRVGLRRARAADQRLHDQPRRRSAATPTGGSACRRRRRRAVVQRRRLRRLSRSRRQLARRRRRRHRSSTVYVRRWSVEPLPTNPNNTLILQVLVVQPRRSRRRRHGRGARSRAGTKPGWSASRQGNRDERPARARSERGFTIIEMLISMVIMVGITGVIFSLVDPSRGTYRTQPRSVRHAAAAARRHDVPDQRSADGRRRRARRRRR